MLTSNEVCAVRKVSTRSPAGSQEPSAIPGLGRLTRHDTRGGQGQPGKAVCPDGEDLPTMWTSLVSVHPSQSQSVYTREWLIEKMAFLGVFTHRRTFASTALGPWSQGAGTDHIFQGEAAAGRWDVARGCAEARGPLSRGQDKFIRAWGRGLREAGEPWAGQEGTGPQQVHLLWSLL